MLSRAKCQCNASAEGGFDGCARPALCVTASRAGLRTAACAPPTQLAVVVKICQIVTLPSGQQGFLSFLFVDFVPSKFSQ